MNLWTGVKYSILNTFLDADYTVLTAGDQWTFIGYAETDMKNSFNYVVCLRIRNSEGVISTITLKAIDKKLRHIMQNFERYVCGPQISTLELLKLLNPDVAELAKNYYSETISAEADGEKLLESIRNSATNNGIASGRLGYHGNPYEQKTADSYELASELKGKLLEELRRKSLES